MTSGLSAPFVELLATLGTRSDDADALAEVCRACVVELAVDGAGVSMIVAGAPHGPMGVSDPRCAAIENLQFTAGEGPCLEAYATRRPSAEPALAHSARWPGFAPGAVEWGMGAAFAFPLQVGRARFGALGLYRVEPGGLASDAWDDAVTIAYRITAGLVAMMAGAPPGMVPTAMDVLDDGAVVHQAAGMVAAQLGVRIEDALIALRARAYAAGASVTVVAHQVVARQLRFCGDGPAVGPIGA